MTLSPGASLGRYQVLGQLGEGGMAIVYKAFQPSLDRTVALKVVRASFAEDRDFISRFEREAKAIARLHHPHIVQVHDYDEQEGHAFLVMEYIEGGTLKERSAELARQGQRLPQREVARIVGEVAEALSYAHGLGIVHRDIKPSNVMLTRDGRAVVSDFGIAKILSAQQQTMTGVGLGTPEYMSPEQGQGQQVDARSDIYSLGVLAYELLCGRLPYSADTPFAVVMAHVRDPLPLPSKVNPEIGPATERVLLRALAKLPSQRFPGIAELGEALGPAVIEDESRQLTAGTAPTRLVQPARLRLAVGPLAIPPALLVGAAVALGAVTVAGVAAVAPRLASPSVVPPTLGSPGPQSSASSAASAAATVRAAGQAPSSSSSSPTLTPGSTVASTPSPAPPSPIAPPPVPTFGPAAAPTTLFAPGLASPLVSAVPSVTAPPLPPPPSLAPPPTAAAPAGTASIAGILTYNGRGQAGVVIKAANAAFVTVASATTDASGAFRITGLAAGTFNIQVQLPPGFSTWSSGGPAVVTVADGQQGTAQPLSLLKAVTGLRPAAFATVAAPLTLAWDPLPDATTYSVNLLDDLSGVQVLSGSTSGTTLAVSTLPSGRRYHWFVHANSGSISVGQSDAYFSTP